MLIYILYCFDGNYSLINISVNSWSDMASKVIIAELLGHRDTIAGLSLSNDSRLVASAGKDGILKVVRPFNLFV